MSNTSYLDTLPVEILYRIFDNLDAEFILLSIRYVCKHLYLTTDSYNRYQFDFKYISKPNFRLICQVIPGENVLALTLSNEDITRGQMQLFLSLCRIERFTRLQSLTLLQIDIVRLTIFLNYILKSSVKSLSISMQTLHFEKSTTLAALLSTAIARYTLQNLYLDIGLHNWSDVKWPTTCTLRSLRLVNSIPLQHLCLILSQSPCLESLVLKEITTESDDEPIHSPPFKQLTSLTFEDGRIEPIKLEECFSLTPSLTYLKLVGNGTLFDATFDGFQWEKIIQSKLPALKTFEFFFCILTYSNYRSHSVQTLIDSYRTSFWLEEIRCSITCDYITNSRKILVYTLPVCHTHFVHHMDLKKISLSNCITRGNSTNMDYVEKLDINITKDSRIPLVEQLKSTKNVVFHHVNDLKLGNDGAWPRTAVAYLSTLLDLSQIAKLSLSVNFLPEHMFNTTSTITLLLSQALNLHSLLLYDYWTPENCMKRMKTICSILSPSIKHLQIRVKDLDDIKYLLDRLEHLTSVTFEYAQMLTINRQEFLQSLAYLNRYSSVWDSQYTLHVWFGKSKE